jgi:hypothetical protein
MEPDASGPRASGLTPLPNMPLVDLWRGLPGPRMVGMARRRLEEFQFFKRRTGGLTASSVRKPSTRKQVLYHGSKFMIRVFLFDENQDLCQGQVTSNPLWFSSVVE